MVMKIDLFSFIFVGSFAKRLFLRNELMGRQVFLGIGSEFGLIFGLSFYIPEKFGELPSTIHEPNFMVTFYVYVT